MGEPIRPGDAPRRRKRQLTESARAYTVTKISDGVRFFVDRVHQVPGVRGVYHRHTGPDDTSVVRTVVDRNDYDLRAAVYDAEATTFEQFPEERCDFLLVTDGSGGIVAGEELRRQGHRLLATRG